jgi:hypothetical protein
LVLGRFVLTKLLFMLVSFLHAYELVVFAIPLSRPAVPRGWDSPPLPASGIAKIGIAV